MKIKDTLCLFIIIIIALLGVKALFHSGFYTSHDGRHQIIRLMHFHQGLVDGQFPVRWAGTAFGGYGYPLFIYTYRLPFWLGEFWYLLFQNLTGAIKFSFAFPYLLSGMTMYWCAKKIWRSSTAGLFSAVLYLWVPYRFLNIFVRAALGEATTFMFLPIFYLSVFELSRNKRNNYWWILAGVLSLAGVILSHSMTLALWLIPFGIWMILNIYFHSHKKKYLFSTSVLILISLLLTAYYWLPAIAEKKYIVFNSALGNYYQAHFVTLSQLIYSKWEYGFDFPGTKDDMMSFSVGITQWLVFGSSLISVIYIILTKKLKFYKEKPILFLYFIITFLLSIYLMTDNGSWFYEFMKKVMVIDLPWRFLGVTVFSVSMLGAGIISMIKKTPWKLLIIIIFTGIAFYTNRNHLKVNQYTNYKDSEYWQDQETSNERDDYAPKWFVKPFEAKDIQLLTFNGESDNILLKRTSNAFTFKSSVESNTAEIITRVAYYPGWETLIDNQERETTYKDGRIRVILEKGTHLVTLIFKETPLRVISNILSFLTLLGIISFFIYAKTKK